jgi:hypothetical protein
MSKSSTEEQNEITFGQKIYSTPYYELYTIDNIKQFIHNVKIWKGNEKDGYSLVNREKDEKKVDEIYKSILDDTLTPSSIYISEIYDESKKKYTLRCWDGQHRWNAIKKYYIDKHIKNISHLFVCYVYRNDTNEQIYKKFRNINKFTPVSVPESFEPIDAKRIILCKKLVDFIKNDFPHNQSTSINCKKPNYNVDTLYTQLCDYIEEHNYENISFEYFKQRILQYNNILEKFYIKKYENINQPLVFKKALKYKCFLFLLDDFTTSLEMNDLNDLDNNTINA